jgi:outer membrane protein assembly factor BamB
LNKNIDFLIESKKKIFERSKKNLYKKKILVTQNNIFFIDDKSNFFILNHDLKILKKIPIYKKKKIKNYFLKFSIIEYENVVYFVDNLGGIFSYDLKQDMFLWKANYQIPFFSNIAIYKDNIYAVNANGKIFSFTSKTGKINWTLETGSQAIKSSGSFGIAIASDTLVFSNDIGIINCIDLIEKKILWSLSINNLLNPKSFEISKMQIRNNDLFFSSNFGSLIKINLKNGKFLWDQNIATVLDPIVNYKTIATIGNNGLLSIYDKKNGKILYNKNIFNILNNDKIKKNIKINNIFTISDKLLFTSTNGFFFLMNFNDLNSIKYKKISKNIMSNISFSKENIFFIGDNKYIYKIK